VKKTIQRQLTKLPDITVTDITIENNIIKRIVLFNTSIGNLLLQSITINDSQELFNFYFDGLSEQARIFFCPYPLFNPRPKSYKELSQKIKDWKKEDDWIVLKLEKNNHIIGICLLKRYKTDRPTSGLAIHEKYQKKGLGLLLQTVINEQAQLLGLKHLIITLAPKNSASLRVHEKAGYKKTGRLVPHYTFVNGIKIVDRQDVEMAKDITD
jgi:RimJ/RimL family protein N-acetyltransferase